MYEDAGVSGARDDRPGLAALLLDLQPGDVVVAYALSRLARGGAVQLLGIVRDIRDRGARIVFLTENIDTDTPTGRLMLTILAALAELEVEQTKERMWLGRSAAAAQGIYPYGPRSLPLGWARGEDGRIVEDEHADTVRWIFAQGQASYTATADDLRRRGVGNRQAGRWTASAVRRLVTQAAYWTGELLYRGEDGQGQTVIPAPPLVTREEWEAAQRARSYNQPYRRPDVFPLTGRVRCTCGARMVGERKDSYRGAKRYYHYYACTAHKGDAPACPVWGKRVPVFPVDPLHDQARALLAELLGNPADPAHIAAAWREVPPPRADERARERGEVERKLAALLDLYLEGVVDRETYDTRRATLTRRAAELSPAPPSPPPTMPPRADLALAVRAATHEELAEFLELLGVELALDGERRLRLERFRPLD